MLPQELLNDEGLRILRKKRKLRKSQTAWVHSIVLSLPSKRNFSAKTVKNYSKGFVKVFCFNQMIFGFITLFRIFCLALQVCAYTRDSLVPMGTFNWTSSIFYCNKAWKVFKYGVFSGPYFPVFGPEKTPYLDTLYAVQILLNAHPNVYWVCNYPR